MSFDLPHDLWTERAFVGGLLAAERFPEGVSLDPTMLWDPNLTRVSRAITALSARGITFDPIALRAELLRSGERGTVTDGAWLVDLMSAGCNAGSLSFHARELRALGVRREVITAATRASQAAADPGSDPYDAAALLHVRAGQIADSGDPIAQARTVDGADFVTGEITYDYLIPGVLERGDRLLITGGEGSGKSVLTRQIGLTSAAGVHPFKGYKIDPVRVLLVDLENGTRHLRRALRGMWDLATQIGSPITRGMLTVESRPSGVDLTKPDDQHWLRRLCEAARPELLVIGPVYRMHAADMNAEEPARALTRLIDSLRAEHNCAVVMETHSPHGQNGAARSLRPVGSSLFMRWPEFGYGLRPKDEDGAIMHLGSWRGPRDERDFPRMLARGTEGEWPWQAYTGLVTPPEGWAS